tara:strand:+ start:2137 stop:4626 length:2490 start_codon:yes stop_codon:yes gene_type:complete
MTDIREPTQEEIQSILGAGDPYTSDRRKATAKVVEGFKQEYSEKTGIKIKQSLDVVGQGFKTKLRTQIKLKVTPVEDSIFKPIMNNVPIDEDKVKLLRKELTNRKIAGISLSKITDDSMISPEYETKIKDYAKELKYDEGENLLYNYTKMKKRFDRLTRFEESKQHMKRVQVDIYKYLGAVSLTSYDTREDVYEYWEEVGDKPYKQFKEDLTNFFDAVENIKDTKLNRFKEEIKEIRDEYEEQSLQYIVKLQVMDMSLPPPVNRFIKIIESIEKLNNLNTVKEHLIEEEEDDEDTVIEGKQEAFEAALLSLENWSEDAELNAREGASIDKDIEDAGKPAEDMFDLERVVIDPLLAIEFKRNKKLLSFNQKAQAELRTLLKKIKGEGVILDMRTDLNNMLDDIEESLSFESADANYHLPITVVKTDALEEYYKSKSFVASSNEGEDEETQITLGVLDSLNTLFDEIHKALTDKRWGFAVMTRAAGREGTFSGEPQVKRKHKGKISDILRDRGGKERGGRQNPKGFKARGDIKPEVFEAISGEIVKLLESATNYYLLPLYSGRLPIEAPRYSTSRGIKVLAAWSNEHGSENVMGESYNLLATVGEEAATADDMKNIADFLEYVDSPSIRIEDGFISAAEQASDSLTTIFGAGTSEQNANYISALLYHFMEESDDLELADSEIEGKEIKERKDLFNEDYTARKPFPIFALPHYLDQNQGILTGSTQKKEQYKRLKQIYSEVEEDIPVLFNKMLKAHDAIREQLGKEVNYAFTPFSHEGIDKVINKMYMEENIDLSHLEVENIVKDIDSHNNISKEYGISEDQVYLIKSHFRR